MKKLPIAIMLLASIFLTNTIFAQDWVKMMQDPNVNFYDVQKTFNQYYEQAERKAERAARRAARSQDKALAEGELEIPGYEQYKRWESFMQPRVSQTGVRFAPEAVWSAMTEYRKAYNTLGAGNWTLLGPVAPTVPSGGGGAGRINFVTVQDRKSTRLNSSH